MCVKDSRLSKQQMLACASFGGLRFWVVSRASFFYFELLDARRQLAARADRNTRRRCHACQQERISRRTKEGERPLRPQGESLSAAVFDPVQATWCARRTVRFPSAWKCTRGDRPRDPRLGKSGNVPKGRTTDQAVQATLKCSACPTDRRGSLDISYDAWVVPFVCESHLSPSYSSLCVLAISSTRRRQPS